MEIKTILDVTVNFEEASRYVRDGVFAENGLGREDRVNVTIKPHPSEMHLLGVDARLCANAQELLDALQWLMNRSAEMLDNHGPDPVGAAVSAAIERGRKAIAQAKGERPDPGLI